MGFRTLRVINDDRVAPGGGFPTHGHRDMEIITYVLDGALEHRDSLGNGSVIRPGEAQRMSAGTGIEHSEMNHSRAEPVRFLQIWILPERRGLPPGYEQRAVPGEERRGKLARIAAPPGGGGAVRLHQDAKVYASVLEPGKRVTHALPPGRHAWVQVARGGIALNDQPLGEGDGAAVSDEQALEITSPRGGELLLFDLA
jgi:redox-sensitive bicupin YhaK (pirin superfamily)